MDGLIGYGGVAFAGFAMNNQYYGNIQSPTLWTIGNTDGVFR